MKKVRQYVAMAAATFMIASVVPSNFIYADEVTDAVIESNEITGEENNDEAEEPVESEDESEDKNTLLEAVEETAVVEESIENEENKVEESLENIDLTEDSISEINAGECSVEVTNFNANSAYVQLNNLQDRFTHIAISYVAKNDSEDGGTKILTGSTGAIINGLRSNTEYEVKAYGIKVSAGSNSGATSTSTYLGSTTFKTAPGDFLVIVGESLFEDSEVRSSLKTYTDDIRKEGINAEIVRVSETEGTDDGSNGVYKCPDATDLKKIIKDRYNNGAEGFVIIGSTPDIPTPLLEIKEGSNWQQNPSDMYYADMDVELQDTQNPNGIPEVLDEYGRYYTPEMYYGRISPRGLVADVKSATKEELDAKEKEYVHKYLERVHDYRINGVNLDSDTQERALIFNNAYKQDRSMADQFSGLMPKVYARFLDDYTTDGIYYDELEKGYGFIYSEIHSSNDSHSFGNYDQVEKYLVCNSITVNDMFNKNIHPKYNFIDLCCCSALDYALTKEDNLRNLGQYYLFESNEGLNVTGCAATKYSGSGISGQREFYDKIANGTMVGKAYKDVLIKNNEGHNTIFEELLGDPTIQYKVTKLQSHTPYITSLNDFAPQLEGSAVAYADKEFCIQAEDDDNDTVDIQIDGLPQNKISNNEKSIIWNPTSEDIGNRYNKVKITAYNEGNRNQFYEETLDFSVRHNPESIYVPTASGNIIENGTVYGDSVIFTQDSMGKVTFNNIEGDGQVHKVDFEYTGIKDATVTIEAKSAEGTKTYTRIFDACVTSVPIYLAEGNNSITIYSNHQDIIIDSLKVLYYTDRIYTSSEADDIQNGTVDGQYIKFTKGVNGSVTFNNISKENSSFVKVLLDHRYLSEEKNIVIKIKNENGEEDSWNTTLRPGFSSSALLLMSRGMNNITIYSNGEEFDLGGIELSR